MFSFDVEALSTCALCPKLCRDVCPTALGEGRETLIPTHKMSLVWMAQKNTLSLDQDLAEVLFACTGCGACTAACKHEMEPGTILYQARERAHQTDVLPEGIKTLLGQLKTEGTPFGPVSQEAFEAVDTSPSPTLLFTGCATNAMKPDDAATLLASLKERTSEQVALFAPSICCGSPLFAAGARQAHAAQTHKLLNQYQSIEHLVIADPHCYHHMITRDLEGNKHPTQQVAKRVSHLLEVYERILPVLSGDDEVKRAFYHDASPLGRFAGQYATPRRLLGRLGYQIIEFTRNRFKAQDSAAGGVYRWSAPDGAIRNARLLLDEVHEYTTRHNLDQPPPVVTVGETERSHLQQAAPDLTILDLNVLIARSLVA